MNKIVRFLQDAFQELKLSSWLSRQQMIGSTIVVIVLTLIMAAYVSLIDRILLFVAGFLLRFG